MCIPGNYAKLFFRGLLSDSFRHLMDVHKENERFLVMVKRNIEKSLD